MCSLQQPQRAECVSTRGGLAVRGKHSDAWSLVAQYKVRGAALRPAVQRKGRGLSRSTRSGGQGFVPQYRRKAELCPQYKVRPALRPAVRQAGAAAKWRRGWGWVAAGVTGGAAEGQLYSMSTLTEEGVQQVKQAACDTLLNARVELKIQVRASRRPCAKPSPLLLLFFWFLRVSLRCGHSGDTDTCGQTRDRIPHLIR